MIELYSGILGIEYGQFYIISNETQFDGDMDEAFKNQENGLCGASVPGFVWFTTGIQNGKISVDIQLCQSRPRQDDSYQEIVEVSLNVGTSPIFLAEWGSERAQQLELPEGNYRLRYSIDGMNIDYDDEAQESNDEYWNSPLRGQRYLIQLWIAASSRDIIVQQTTDSAKYWHKELGKS